MYVINSNCKEPYVHVSFLKAFGMVHERFLLSPMQMHADANTRRCKYTQMQNIWISDVDTHHMVAYLFNQ